MGRISHFLRIGTATFLINLLPFVCSAAYQQGPGHIEAPIITQNLQQIGTAKIWNTARKFQIRISPAEGWEIETVKIYVSTNPVPTTPKGHVIPGKLTYKDEYANDGRDYKLILDLKNDLRFSWGAPYAALRLQNVAIFTSMNKIDGHNFRRDSKAAWVYTGSGCDTGTYDDFEGVAKGWKFTHLLTHPKRGHFIDAPVAGVTFATPTSQGMTDESGGFDYFPGEMVNLSLGRYALGSTLADHRISPLDLFEQQDTDSPQVINMARLLQSFDDDGFAKNGIRITPQVVGHFEAVMEEQGHAVLDFNDGAQIDEVIEETVKRAALSNPLMVVVSAEDAKAHLDSQLSAAMFRKNVSKTPEMATTKSKVDLMPVLVPATRANGELVVSEETGGYGVDFYDEDGYYLYTREKVKPLVSVYADQVPETGMSDTFAAVSRDDGKTWKRTNLSRAADLSSFTLANGEPYYGDVKKPNLSIKGNHVLAVWQSKFCRGGRPLYSREEFLDDGITPDPYFEEDLFGVGGPQRSHDYTEDGFPEVGELPFYCLWVARGTIDPATAEITWRKPERLTSGRRDVYQISVNGANNVGFGIVWQEDPEGVRPGEMAGPGHGWSGATTNHKTDIWYSFIRWADFAAIDENFTPNGDPAHSFDDPDWTTNRPMPLVPFAMPRRLSDNDVCNTDNMKIQLGEDGFPLRDENGRFIPIIDPEDPEWDGKHTGTHRYCYLLDDNNNGIPDLCADFYTFVNEQGATKNVCVTEDGRLLDGDTGASRPNISFMPYQKVVNNVTVNSAWVAIAYEETKGVGGGAPDHTGEPPYGGEDVKPDSGKNVIYHSFDFAGPAKVSGGDIVNLPARDAEGNLLYLVDAEGYDVLDWRGEPQLAYENARRPRMLVQPAGQAGSSGTVMVLVYKQGEEGKGRQSDIFLRRVVKGVSGNPYAYKNFVCNAWVETDICLAPEEDGSCNAYQRACIDGAQNLSSVTPTEYWENPNQDDQAKGEGIKVVKYEQGPANLADASWTNPYDDARAHRGILRGNNIYFAYDYTPNWAAARNAHDKYDLFIRRSFDGGQSWTTDPAATEEICHTNIWKDYDSVSTEDEANQKETYEEVVCFGPGEFEPARNMSQLANNKLSVIEPRLVGPPSTTPGSPYPEDIFNPNVYYVTFGTAHNVPKLHGNLDEDEEEEHATPADLYYTFTQDRGQNYFKRLWEVNPDSQGPNAGEVIERWDYLAKGDPEQGEAQIRMAPDGSRFYAVWNQEGEDGSDCWFRRIMNKAFALNLSELNPEYPDQD